MGILIHCRKSCGTYSSNFIGGGNNLCNYKVVRTKPSLKFKIRALFLNNNLKISYGRSIMIEKKGKTDMQRKLKSKYLKTPCVRPLKL